MKSKLEMAHDYAMLHMMNPQYKDADDLEMVQWAFDYADAMQAEADKRENIQTQETECNHEPYGSVDGYDRYICKKCNKVINVETNSCVEKEWQPDWSQAPDGRVQYFAVDKNGRGGWYVNKPDLCHDHWYWSDFGERMDNDCYSDAPSFNYQGDWRDSLRKRHQ